MVFIAPSGVQKERIHSSHIFVLPFPQPAPSPNTDRFFLRRPAINLKESACTPLFWNAFDLRDAGSCIHTHSQNAVMATLLWTGPMFRISHQVSIREAVFLSSSYASTIPGGISIYMFVTHD
jgi:methylthioribulose-1-phosphate dehydratase